MKVFPDTFMGIKKRNKINIWYLAMLLIYIYTTAYLIVTMCNNNTYYLLFIIIPLSIFFIPSIFLASIYEETVL